MVRKTIIITIGILLGLASWRLFPLLTSAQSVISIIGCDQITSPGTYRIANNLTTVGPICLDIKGNDITIDGNGKTITMQNGGSALKVMMNDPSVPAQRWHNITVSNFVSKRRFSSVC